MMVIKNKIIINLINLYTKIISENIQINNMEYKDFLNIINL